MVALRAYLSKQRGRRTQKETKHREKYFITARTSVPPNNVPTTVKYLQISNFTVRNEFLKNKYNNNHNIIK